MVDHNANYFYDGDKIVFFFYIGFVPADEETYKKCEERVSNFNNEINKGIFNGVLIAGITFEVNNSTYDNLKFYYHKHNGSFKFMELKDYKALKNRFVVDLIKFKKTIDKTIAELGIGSDYGIDFQNIYNFMKNYDVNDLIE